MQEIELAILRHLSSNPEAEDTLQGITEWWLLRQKIASEAPAVECALAMLASRDMVVPRRVPEGGVRYRLNPQCRESLEHLLARYSGLETDRGRQGSDTKMRKTPRSGSGRKEHQ